MIRMSFDLKNKQKYAKSGKNGLFKQPTDYSNIYEIMYGERSKKKDGSMASSFSKTCAM